jgi:glycosyltransferase involved in cell wall biosynthesis
MGLAGVLAAKLKSVPLVVEVNGIPRLERISNTHMHYGIMLKLRDHIENAIETIIFKTAAKIISVTEAIKNILISDYSIPTDKIIIIPNGVDPTRFQPMDQMKCREKLGIDKNAKIICFIGHYTRYQGIEELLQAGSLVCKRFPRFKILIVGPHTEIVPKRLSKKLKIGDKTIFIGTVPYYEVPKYINASDICAALPTKGRKKMGSSGLKIFEYMACGKPVISTRINGLEDIEKYNAGLIVDNDIRSISEGIFQLLADDTLREELGKNARRLVVNKYTWDINARKTAAVCNSVIL